MNPAYLHVALHSLPIVGAGIGAVLLLRAWLARQPVLRTAALAVLAGTLAAGPVLYFSGEAAEDAIEDSLDAPSKAALEEHEDRGKVAFITMTVGALLALAALFAPTGWGVVRGVLAVLALAGAVASIGAGAWASQAGGQIRHPEFRGDAPAAGAPAHGERGS